MDVENEGICDTYESFVWEPLLVKRNAISAATEAACLILSVDETVMNPNSEQAKAKANPMNKGALAGLARGRGRGRGRRWSAAVRILFGYRRFYWCSDRI